MFLFVVVQFAHIIKYGISDDHLSIGNYERIDHFRVPLNLIMKARLSAKFLL